MDLLLPSLATLLLCIVVSLTVIAVLAVIALLGAAGDE